MSNPRSASTSMPLKGFPCYVLSESERSSEQQHERLTGPCLCTKKVSTEDRCCVSVAGCLVLRDECLWSERLCVCFCGSSPVEDNRTAACFRTSALLRSNYSVQFNISFFFPFFFAGDHSGRMGRHHVLCYGCTFLLQFYIFYISHNSKYVLFSDVSRHTCEGFKFIFN